MPINRIKAAAGGAAASQEATAGMMPMILGGIGAVIVIFILGYFLTGLTGWTGFIRVILLAESPAAQTPQ